MTLSIKAPNVKSRIDRVCNDLISKGSKRLSDFRTKCLLKVGLVPSSFDFQFSWNTNTSTDLQQYRKSVSKIRMILLKNINKVMPYTLFSTVPVLDIHNRDSLALKIKVPSFQLDLTKITADKISEIGGDPNIYPLTLAHVARSNSIRQLVLNQIGEEELIDIKSMNRYVRYLNYLCRKYGLAVIVTIGEFKVDFDSILQGTSTSRNTVLNMPEVDYSVNFTFRCWIPPNLVEESRVRTEGLVEDVIYTDAHAARNGGAWSHMAVGDSRSGISVNSTPDALFLFLPQINTVCSTLTRKVFYDVGAYEFKTTGTGST